MRDNWTYKKMSEVFDLQMGKTPDRKTPSYFGGDNVWVSIRDLVGKEIGESNEHITDTAVITTNIRKVKKGTVIMSFKLTVGKCAITTKDLYTNEAIMAFNLNEGYDIIPDYLYYYLSNYNWKGANKAVMGITLNKATISQQRIGYPPLSEQQSIVAELDKINELMNLKKAQLKDLDALAQSIFYDMFGDPIENEKGWEVKKLGEIGEPTIGLTYKPDNVTSDGTGTIVLRSSNIQDSKLDFEDIVRVNISINDSKYVKDGDILMCSRNGSFKLVGKVAMIHSLSERMSYGAFMTIIRSEYNPYLFGYFKTSAFREYLIQGKTTTVNQITVQMLKDIKLPLPPLSLQQDFAKRIELIEQQKAQISSSIKDLETLLASRMQYWFD